MKEEKRAVLQSIRKEFKTDDKLEQLVMGMALRKWEGAARMMTVCSIQRMAAR